MNYKLILFFILCFYSAFLSGQKRTADMHNGDSCNVCNCEHWHYLSSYDDQTKDSIFSVFKEHVAPADCGGSDIFTRYESKDYTFYKTGKVHIIRVEKGWYNGWKREANGQADWLDENGKLKSREIYKKDKITHIEYDENGKKIKKTKLKKAKIRAKY